MEIIIILLLIILNGVFAMAEIAIISARKHKLKRLANEGSKAAKIALELSNNPNKFLSTVQIGITLIGILAGAFGGATLAKSLSVYLSALPLLDPYSDALGVGIVVITITYLSLVIGELVPKRIALNNPEVIALFFSRFMNILASAVSPFVRLLSISNDLVLKILRIRPKKQALVSEDEVRMLIAEGTKIGIFERAEKDIVERTLLLDDQKLSALMTPRNKIAWLDINDSPAKIRTKISKLPHSHYPVCKGSLDNIVGVVRTENILTDFLASEEINLKQYLRKPLFAPNTMTALKVLEVFKKSGIHIVLVVQDKKVVGLVSLTDILEAIVGDISTIDEQEDET
ncbi:HlyC/CorC family transporter [Candidatus Daviesbacteria bacterium]|nr:HlyC/CorC family transporter [Candidatus Daviesbacteria bacterium]